MKKIVALLGVFLGLAAFVYFYEIEGQKKREEAKELEESLLRTRQEEITGLEVSRSGQQDLVLIKEGEGWTLQEPIETAADSANLEALLRNLEGARRDRTLAAETDESETYGLTEPRMTLKIRTGDQERTLLIGGEDYTGSKIYVQFAGTSDVFLTSDQIYSSADKDLKDWRSKKVLFFESNKTQAIEIDGPKGQIRLRRREDWFLEKPLSERADQNTVSSLLSALQYGEAQDFVSDQPKELNQYGLDNPRAKIRVRHEGQDRWSELEVGKEVDGNYYARNPDRVPVFTVQEDLLSKLTQDLWAFRDKDVINVPQDQIAQLVIRREEDEIVLRREDFKWIVEEPEAQRDQEAIGYKFWYPMDDIKYESIEEAGSTSESAPEPAVEVILTLKDGGTRTFTFAQEEDEFVASQQESGREGTISSESFEKLQFKIEDIVSSNDA
ncbi:MAG: DUF4340 domain-containing protein [Acidobacteriota bacterium]